MAYQNVGTPRFYIDYLSYFSSIGAIKKIWQRPNYDGLLEGEFIGLDVVSSTKIGSLGTEHIGEMDVAIEFYDNIPQDLIDMFKKAYPNVDIQAECEKARAWLLTNTNKAKKDFKGFTNRWLGKACNNGGQTMIKVDKLYEQQDRQVK